MSYTPWANGTIERHNRECFKISRTILSKSGPSWNLKRWPKIVPLVQYSLNTAESKSLENMYLIKVFTDRRPKSAVDLLAFSGHIFEEVKISVISADWLKTCTNKL